MIKAIEYIKTGFSADDAAKLNEVIQPIFDKGEKVIVDFSGITIFTTLFFNNVFAKYILKIGPSQYGTVFEVVNLSELGKTTYQHSYDNAVNYYGMSEGAKKAQDGIVENPD